MPYFRTRRLETFDNRVGVCRLEPEMRQPGGPFRCDRQQFHEGIPVDLEVSQKRRTVIVFDRESLGSYEHLCKESDLAVKIFNRDRDVIEADDVALDRLGIAEYEAGTNAEHNEEHSAHVILRWAYGPINPLSKLHIIVFLWSSVRHTSKSRRSRDIVVHSRQ